MTDQTLFPLPIILTAKQAETLQLLTAHPQGLRSTDLGRYLHMQRNAPCACSPNVVCRWAHSDGERYGKQLRQLEPPQAIKRRTGLWTTFKPVRAVADPGVDPFPQGF